MADQNLCATPLDRKVCWQHLKMTDYKELPQPYDSVIPSTKAALPTLMAACPKILHLHPVPDSPPQPSATQKKCFQLYKPRHCHTMEGLRTGGELRSHCKQRGRYGYVHISRKTFICLNAFKRTLADTCASTRNGQPPMEYLGSGYGH